MEQQEEQNPSPELYYDYLNGQHLIGRTALEAHLLSGGHPLDVVSLREAINNPDIPIPFKAVKTDPTVSVESILADSRFVLRNLDKPEDPREIEITTTKLSRLGRLGVITSIHMIRKRFGSLTGLYSHLEVKTSPRYHHLTPEAARQYVQELFLANDKMPTEELLDQEAAKDKTKPPYRVLLTRLPGGLTKLRNEEGFDLEKNLEPHSIKLWSLAYVINNGVVPTQAAINIMSPLGKSVSEQTISKKYTNLSNFQVLTQSTHEQWMDVVSMKKGDIQRAIEKNQLPGILYSSSKDDVQMICWTSRYQIAKRLLPDAHQRALILLATHGYSDERFIRTLGRINSNVGEEVVSEICSDLGYLPDMWRRIRDDLKLVVAIEARIEQKRGILNEEEQEHYESVVALMVDFMLINRLEALRSNHIKFLQKKRYKVPGAQKLGRLFGNQNLLFNLIHEKVRLARLENKKNEEAIKECLENDLENGRVPNELFLNFAISRRYREQGLTQANAHFSSLLAHKEPPSVKEWNRRFRPISVPVNDEEKVKRYAKWQFLNAFIREFQILDIDTADMICLCAITGTNTFAQDLLRVADARTISVKLSDIESMATSMGTGRYVTPPYERYVESLTLPNRRRQNNG